jgi:hypothetical protein
MRGEFYVVENAGRVGEILNLDKAKIKQIKGLYS